MFAKHSLYYIAAWVIPSAVNFGSLLVFTRLLSPADYGLYATTVVMAAFLHTTALNWLCASALRLFGAAEDRGTLLATILWSYLGVVALLGAAALAAHVFVPELADPRLVAAGFVLTCVNGWVEICLHLLRAELKSGHYAAANILRSIAGGGAAVALAALGFGVYGALCGIVLGSVVTAVWTTLKSWSSFRPVRPDPPLVRKLLDYGLPLTASYALEAVYWYSDRVLLAAMLGAGAVGLYAAGFDMADKTIKGIMAAVGSGAGLPLAIRALEDGGQPAARRQLARNLTILLAGGLPAAVGLVAVSPELALFLGESFRVEARALIPIIAVATFLSALRGNYFDHAFYLGRRTAPFILVMAGGAAVNFGLCLLLIPRFGTLGAGYATLAAYVSSLVLGAGIGRRVFALPVPWLELGKIVLAAAAMAAVVTAVPGQESIGRMVAQMLTGGISYAILVVVFDVGGCRGPILARLVTKFVARSSAPRPSENSPAS